MTQQDVYNILKKKDKWMTAREIGTILELSDGSITTSLNKLLKYGEVMKRKMGTRKLSRFGFLPFQWKIR